MRRVYFIKPVGLSGPIKIGCSVTPDNRLLELAVWSPFKLELMGSVPGEFADEGFLHRCFADTHSHREWFDASPDLLVAIKEVLAAGTVDVLRGRLTEKADLAGIRPHLRRTEDGRRRASYHQRVGWAERKLRRALGENGRWYTPADVRKTMERWSGWGRAPQVRPTDAELARVEQYLENPALHSVSPPWLSSKAVA